VPAWLQALLVGVGGAAGAMARFGVSKLSASVLGTTFPYGTLIVNAAGSLLLGLLTGLALGRFDVPTAVKLLVGVGFCGAFTTFSTFAVDTLASRGLGLTLLNVALNNLVSIGLAGLGWYVGVRM
jgi:CrcB protein